MEKDISLAIQAAKQMDLADAGLAANTDASEGPACRESFSRVVHRWLGGYEPEVKRN